LITISLQAFNQHDFAKGCTQKETEDIMLSTLKESIRIPGQMVCLLHPSQVRGSDLCSLTDLLSHLLCLVLPDFFLKDPVPFRRVWCLFELYTAITLGAKVIMHFPPADAKGFYSKLHQTGEATALVPTIDANQAQATVESDRVRIFQEITDRIGMDKFNRQLQEYLERALRGVATEALLQHGGVESLSAGGSKVTMEMLRGELEQLKPMQETTQQEVQATKKEVQETKKEVQETKKELKQEAQETNQEVRETKQELTVLAAVQEETKQELAFLTAVQQEAKQEMQQRMSALEGKMDVMLELLSGGTAAATHG
jgi:hypothetical protein